MGALHKKIMGLVTIVALLFVCGTTALGQEWTPAVEAWVKTTNADPQFKNASAANGFTLAHFAAHAGRVDVLKWLNTQGVNFSIKTRGGFGWTPMHSAAAGGQIEAMQWLMEQGLSLTVKDNEGRTPAYYVAPQDTQTAAWIEAQTRAAGSGPAATGGTRTAMQPVAPVMPIKPGATFAPRRMEPPKPAPTRTCTACQGAGRIYSTTRGPYMGGTTSSGSVDSRTCSACRGKGRL